MKKLYFILSTIFFISCVESFDYEPENFDRLLVVDGGISNENINQQIKLSYTFPIDEEEGMPVANAEVYVETSSGSRINFIEGEVGSYITADPFSALPGESYQLFINTETGDSYFSNKEVLENSVPIDSVYARYEEILTNESNELIGGIQFFIDTHDDSGTSRFFRYSWDETYQIIVPFPSFYQFNSADSTWSERTEDVGTCYNSNNSDELIIGSTAGSELNRVSALPVKFAGIEDDVLRNRYSINVRQFSINREAHDFYSKLKEINNTGGSLFDKQLGIISGNIFSQNNPNEPVLGYFEVASVSEKRAFFNARDFPSPFIRPTFRFDCDQNDVFVVTPQEIPETLVLNTRRRILFFGLDGNARISSRNCSDCSWYSPNIKPDFWID